MNKALGGAAAGLALLTPTCLADTPTVAWLAMASLCTPLTAQASAPAATAQRPVVLTGFGTGGFPVSRVPAAQRWFDQGVATGWAFSHREHLRAFEEAQRLDPACGMCAWGEAAALAPTINFGVDAAKRRRALVALDRAAARSVAAPALHRDLIAAARLRFADPDANDRKAADRAYADAMERLAARHPADDAVAVMAADAVMVAHDGVGDVGPSAGEAAPSRNADLRRAERLLERVMARSPNHTGALHFYIHLTEWLDEAGKAEAAADRLGPLAPAAGHLVHMPSHTYGRIGRWRDAARVNRLASDADTALAARTGLEAARAVPYHAHNMHFRTITALAAGDRVEALDAAADLMREYPLARTGAGFGEVIGAAAYYVHGRYASAAEIAALPTAPADRLIMRTARHYALGEAAYRAGDRRELARQLKAIVALRRALPQSSPNTENARTFTDLTRRVLEGREAALGRRWGQAAARFAAAAEIQRRIGVAGDPPSFWFNARRAQGQALMRAGRLDAARTTLTQALREWPNDPVGLAALAETERLAGREDAWRATWARAYRAWAGDPAALRPDAV